MPERFEGDGDVWEVALDRFDPNAGTRAVVFHCVSDSQRPYRVVEVPTRMLARADGVSTLSDRDLHTLFDRSQTMNYTMDAAAEPFGPDGQALDLSRRNGNGAG